MASKTLYPPVIDYYMPAFAINQGFASCNIYFALSFNSIDEVKGLQLSISSQSSNKNQLSSRYPMEIKRYLKKDIKISTKKESEGREDKYYITLSNIDIKGGFQPDFIYKVQLRLDNVDSELTEVDNSFIKQNLELMSEWSTVCLLKPIRIPSLQVKGGMSKDSNIILSSIKKSPSSIQGDSLEISAKLVFADFKEADDGLEENETLQNYKLTLVQEDLREIKEETDIIQISSSVNPNEFTYSFKYQLRNNKTYKLIANYTTKNGYTNTSTYFIKTEQDDSKRTDVNIEAIPEKDTSRNGIVLYSDEKFEGIYMISRSDSSSNFSKWEDIHKIILRIQAWNNINEIFVSPKSSPLEESNDLNDYFEVLMGGDEFRYQPEESVFVAQKENSLEKKKYCLVWCDNTPESNEFYSYRVQKIVNGERYVGSYLPTPVLNDFDNMIIAGGNQLLNIQFNTQISSYKPVRIDSITNTIGGKYPVIRRNESVAYNQFSISGLISFLGDEKQIFKTKEDLFENTNELYQDFNLKNRIDKYNDFIYEKKFRKEVIDFLCDGKLKLLKTLQEGNFIVRLTDVSLTPFQAKNRYLYTFSATATEVKDNNVNNYLKYNIQSFLTDYENLYVLAAHKKDTPIEAVTLLPRGSEKDLLAELPYKRRGVDIE